MRPLLMPTGEKDSQEELLRRIRQAHGCVAHLRVLMVRDDGHWAPVGGRVDVARATDHPRIVATPVGGARVLQETVTLDELAQRLTAAFAGGPFTAGGESLPDHGLNSTWVAGRYTDSWREYGVRWPITEFVPTQFPTHRPYLYDIYEAEGEVEALDGVFDCVRLALGYSGVRSVSDVRGKRFGICVWDYRGVFRRKRDEGVIRFAVEPGGDPALRLSLVAHDDSGAIRKTFRSPEVIAVPLAGALHRLNMTLRHNDEIVCELLWDETTERFRLENDGVYRRPPVSPAADPVDAGSTVAAAALPFMVDAGLARMVARDLSELDSTIQAANFKSAVVLAGSILEAILLDVVGRNEHQARRCLGKDWPDRASASRLIAVASNITVLLADGSTAPLLPPLTKAKSAVLVDHRDLVHPRAEVRAAATFDAHTVQTMRGILGEVLRDLRDADARGVLAQYAAGKLA